MNGLSKNSKEIKSAFENFVCTKLLKAHFDILQRTNNYELLNTDSDIENEFPCLQVRSKLNNKSVWIELLFLNTFPEKNILINQTASKKYSELDIEEPIYFIIGIGGEPSSPEKISILPFSKLNGGNINSDDINYYSKSNYTTIDYHHLADLSGNNFIPENKKYGHENYTTQKTKKSFKISDLLSTNYLLTFVALIIAFLGFEFFYSGHKDVDSKADAIDTHRLMVEYYSATEKGDLNFIEKHLADTLLFWKDKNNISKSTVIENEKIYLATYPERYAEIVNGSFTYADIGNGITKIRYLLDFSYRKRGTKQMSNMQLKIAVLLKNETILGMQEE